MTGGIPLCVRWESFPDMLEFFPNAHTIVFGSGEIVFDKKGSRWERPNTFLVSEMVWIAKDGSVMGAVPFFPIDKFDYNLVRMLNTGWREEGARPFSVQENGQLNISDVFLQPVRHFVVRPNPQEHDDWLTILERRAAIGVPTNSVLWMMANGEERSVLPLLAQAAPKTLGSLSLEISPVEPLSVTLDTIMNVIDDEHFPNLGRLLVRLHCYHGVMRDAEARHRGLADPEWMTNKPPSKLKIDVDLVLSTDIMNEPSDEVAASQAMSDTLPLLWIENARRKLGESSKDRLSVRTSQLKDGRVQPFNPPFIVARLKHALLGPNP